MQGGNRVISIVLACLLTSFILPSFSQAQSPDFEPQITVECSNWNQDRNTGPISYSLGSGTTDCYITNDDQRRIKFEVSWMAEKMGVFTDTYNNGEISSGDEFELASGEEFAILFILFPEKMEPGEVSFDVEVVVTATQEVSGWRDCQNCEPHEFETEYEIGPWATINRGKISESNVPGIPTGTTLDDDTRITLENDLICSENILTEQNLDYTLFLESSNAGREYMYAESRIDILLHNYNDDELIEIEQSFEGEFDENGQVTFSASLNLEAPEERSGEWYVRFMLSGFVSTNQTDLNRVLDGTTYIDTSCILDNSILDPDYEEELIQNAEEVSALSLLPTLTLLAIAAILHARNLEDI